MMNQGEYYIGTGKSSKGPFDLIMLVRKIRNGLLTEDIPIHLGNDAEAQPAGNWVELAGFFKEKKEEVIQPDQGKIERIAFYPALLEGWNFLQEHTISSILAAMIVLIAVCLAAVTYLFVPVALQVPANMVIFIVSYALINFYLLAILRMIRGQPLDTYIMIDKISFYFSKILYASTLIALPTAIGLGLVLLSYSLLASAAGLVIVTIPGLLWITLHVFAPLLIMDKDMPVMEAMRTSRGALLKSGMENIGNIYGLFAINFIAGLLTLLPMVFSLPITLSAITNEYDDYFS